MNPLHTIMNPKSQPHCGYSHLVPSLLISYSYRVFKERILNTGPYVDWALDSGAFTDYTQGNKTDVNEYIDFCQKEMAADKTLAEVFALDVIGDYRMGLKNVEAMWKVGIEAIPCYHVGEPDWVLKELAKTYPKIALGGAVRYIKKTEWAQQCFSRVWPKRIHGFGFGSVSMLHLPWDSTDSSNWTTPQRYGYYSAFGQKIPRRKVKEKENIECEIYFDLINQRTARRKWKGVEKLLPGFLPTSRFSCSGIYPKLGNT